MAMTLDLPNFGAPAPDLYTGGQPQPETLARAQAQGLRTVINLRPPSEDAGYDEAARAAELGLRYVTIPVAGPADLGIDQARALAQALADNPAPVLVHCASGNRVGALFALKAHHLDGQDLETALATGRAHGLKAMEPAVRQRLGG